MIGIRGERAGDIAAIREVNRRAFGRDHEADIVDALRTNGGGLLSLVAILDGRVVGHIMYSPLVVGHLTGAAIGPMAVLPEHQRQGIGSRLIDTGTRRLRAAACPFIAVLGHADYYPRFGFTRAADHGIACEWDVPDEVFMVLVLDAARSGRVSGRAKYRDEFSCLG